MENRIRTYLLLGCLTILLVVMGGFFGRGGMIAAFVLAVGMNWFSYFFGDRIVLALYRARPLDRSAAPEVHRIVERLCMSAGIPVPKLYLIPQETPNAFATGRDPAHASVAVTQGIMRLLSERELSGVLAHELSHVRNRDILIATIAATLAGVITFLARMLQWGAYLGGGGRDDDRGGNILTVAAMLLFAILAPLAALLIQMAVSRSREYLADEEGARLCGNPRYLGDSLRKLAAGVRDVPIANPNPSTAHLFIVQPFNGRSLMNLFSTHPPLEERIRRLEQMVI